jgi:hypothetical protein
VKNGNGIPILPEIRPLPPSEVEASRTASFIASPDFLQTVTEWVAAGGSLTNLCEERGLRYAAVFTALHLPEHKDLWEAALKARSEWMIESVLTEVRKVASLNIKDAFDEDGRLLPLDKMPPHVSAAIASVDTYELEGKNAGTLKRVKFYDKLKAIELLGKNLKIWVERHEGGGDVYINIQNYATPAIEAAASNRITTFIDAREHSDSDTR